jgi:predicted Zn-dependent peptidase
MMGMGSNRSSKLFEKTYRSLIYDDDKYAVNSKPLTYNELCTFAESYFHPSNMIISIISPETPQNIFDLFKWEVEKPSTNNMIVNEPYIRSLKAGTAPIRKESEGGGERSFLFWGFVKAVDDDDKPALRALGLLLSDHIIFKIREEQGRAYRMKAGIDLVEDQVLFYINLGTRPVNIDPILEQAPGFFSQETIKSFKDFDLQKAINMYLGRMMFRRLSSINKGYYLGHSEYFHQNIMYDSEFLTKLKNITLSDVQKVAEKYMEITNPVTVIVR